METGTAKKGHIAPKAHVQPDEGGENGERGEQRTAEFMLRLLEEGLIREIKPPVADLSPYRDYEPLAVKGKPLSEIIIEDRQ